MWTVEPTREDFRVATIIEECLREGFEPVRETRGLHPSKPRKQAAIFKGIHSGLSCIYKVY